MRPKFIVFFITLLTLWAPKPGVADESFPVFDPYGFIKFEAIYDETEVAQGDWLLFVRPDDTQYADQNVFTMNARHTRLGIKIDGGPVGQGRLSGLVEVDFAGGFPNSSTAARQPLLRLRHGWVQMAYTNWELRFGQDWALISGPFPNTTSFVVGAGKGNLWMRYPQAKAVYKRDSFKIAASLNRPMAGNQKYDDNAGGDFDFVGDGERSGLPWAMGRVWWSHPRLVLSASGHHGMEEVADLSGTVHELTSYSVNADAVVSVDRFKLTVRAFLGENLNSFFGGVFQGFALDSVSVTNVESRGGFAELRYQLSDQFSLTAGGGVDDPDEEALLTGMRSRNSWAFGNIAYSPVKPFVIMLEQEYLETEYVDKPGGSNLRTQYAVYYKF